MYSGSPASHLSSIDTLIGYTRTNTNLTQEYANGLLNWGKAAFGYGYGGTRVLNSESPGAWIEYIRENTNLIQKYLTAKGDDGVLYTAGNWLKSAVVELRSIDTLSGYIRTNTDLNQSYSRQISNYLKSTASDGVEYSAAGYLNMIAARLKATGDDGVSYSAAGFLNMIAQRTRTSSSVLDSITKGPEGGRVSLYNIGNSIETIKNETRDFDNLLEDANTWLGSIDERVTALDALGVRLANIALTADDIRKGVSSSVQWSEVLHGDLSMLRHGAADLLPGHADWTLWDFLQGIYFDLGSVVDLLKGLQQTLTAWGNRWDAQDLYLMEWAKRWDALDKSPADLSETNKLLGLLTADVASIRGKYVVGDSLSDMFGALVGDLQVPATAAAIDGIKGAMSTAFPFCIPSVVNLVLFGSVVADPQAPCWEFDIVGSPLVVDFADFEDFAEVCRWTVRLLFVAALLLNTRKFVYGVGGAD